MSLKTENTQFLTALNQVVLQDIKKSFEGAHLDAKTIGIHLPHYESPQLSQTTAQRHTIQQPLAPFWPLRGPTLLPTMSYVLTL